jgi:hypothetical protein
MLQDARTALYQSGSSSDSCMGNSSSNIGFSKQWNFYDSIVRDGGEKRFRIEWSVLTFFRREKKKVVGYLQYVYESEFVLGLLDCILIKCHCEP